VINPAEASLRVPVGTMMAVGCATGSLSSVGLLAFDMGPGKHHFVRNQAIAAGGGLALLGGAWLAAMKLSGHLGPYRTVAHSNAAEVTSRFVQDLHWGAKSLHMGAALAFFGLTAAAGTLGSLEES
jgi:hypothetical protein